MIWTYYYYYYYYYWSLLYSAILRSRADSLRSHVILHEWIAFYSAFLNIHWSGVIWLLLDYASRMNDLNIRLLLQYALYLNISLLLQYALYLNIRLLLQYASYLNMTITTICTISEHMSITRLCSLCMSQNVRLLLSHVYRRRGHHHTSVSETEDAISPSVDGPVAQPVIIITTTQTATVKWCWWRWWWRWRRWRCETSADDDENGLRLLTPHFLFAQTRQAAGNNMTNRICFCF